MIQDKFKVALIVMAFSTIAIGNQIYADPADETVFKVSFTSAHEDAHVINDPDGLKRIQQEQDYLDQARANSNKVGNILKEPHPDEIYIGDPQITDWPESKAKTQK